MFMAVLKFEISKIFPESGSQQTNNTNPFVVFSFFWEINIFGHTNGARHWLYITCFNLELVLCFTPSLNAGATPFYTPIYVVFMCKKYGI